MLDKGDSAPAFSLDRLDETSLHFESASERPRLLIFFETDCPTCRLAIPYVNRLASIIDSEQILGISQDGKRPTRELIKQTQINFPVVLDRDLKITKQYDPIAVPTFFLVGLDGVIQKTLGGFDKSELNQIASIMNGAPTVIAEPFDGAPDSKFGCVSRHLESAGEGEIAEAANPYLKRGSRATRIELDESTDPFEFCMQFGDPLPVVPPTVE